MHTQFFCKNVLNLWYNIFLSIIDLSDLKEQLTFEG